MLKAVIFDMDGTLLDSEIIHYIVIHKVLLDRLGYDQSLEEYMKYCGVPDPQMFPQILSELNETKGKPYSGRFPDEKKIADESAALESLHWSEYDTYIRENGITGFPGMRELLADLHAQGIKIAIATGSKRSIVRDNIERLGIKEYVDAFATSEDCAHGKPEPDVFLTAARFLGVSPSDCLAVEDARNGLLAARRAGMCIVGFNGSQIPAETDLAPFSFPDYRAVTVEDFHKWYDNFR